MDTLAQAKEFFMAGLAHYQAGRFEAADRQFSAALALAPGRVSILTNLGVTRMKLAKFQEAVDLLGEALQQDPCNVEAWGHRATALAELGKHGDALAAIDRALALHPALGIAWSVRGSVLREMGRTGEAAQAFRKALEHGADRELNSYCLASLEEGAAPPTPPAGYVESLFDGYADGFEQHLVNVLHYRAPEILVDHLRQQGRVFSHALDLGCGTGLCGPLLRPLSRRLEGVDLSANMVRQAQARGAYDEVRQGDAVAFLRSADKRHDLIVAADVFIYVGALDAVFEAAAGAMPAGGVFCFSVEKVATREFALRSSLRYAHSARYLERLAAAHGFDVQACAELPIREDQGAPIAGLFYWLVKR
jgi:predicted TPR repeat methyltransferase